MAKERQAPLRPRGILALFDSTLHLISTTPALVGLAFAGIGPVAILSLWLWYGATEQVFTELEGQLIALACAGATLWRYIPAGAVSRLVVSGLSGRPVSWQEAFRCALGRAPSLMAAGAIILWVMFVSIPLLFVPLLAWSGAFLAIPLVMERESTPGGVIGASRRILRERSVVAGLATALWMLAVLAVALNLWVGVLYGLMLARSLFDVEVGFLARLLSPANPLFLPSVGALSLVLLEPVRQTSVALLYVDAKVRREALDLQSGLDRALERKPPSGRSIARVATLLLACGLGAGIARADEGRDRLGQAVVEALSLGVEIDHRSFLDTLDALDASQDAALVPLAERIEADLASGDTERARMRLAHALAEMNLAVQSAPETVDPREVALAVLARPEFQRVERVRMERVRDGGEPEADERGLVQRFLDWLDELLREFFGRDRVQSRSEYGGIGQSIGWILWVVLLTFIIVIVAIALIRVLGGERADRKASQEARPGGSSQLAGPVDPGVIDALAFAPDAWLAQADALAREGKFREALRAAYLALLSALHRGRAIDYVATQTNWDHVRGFRGPADAKEGFQDLTRRFEFAWYGLRPVDSAAYQIVRSGALKLGNAQDPSDG